MEFVTTLVIISVVVVSMAIVQKRRVEPYQTVSTTGGLLTLKPTLWWFVDDETNARNWWDYGARNSAQPNRGYLQVALESVYATQSFDFQIKPLVGRQSVCDAIKEVGDTVPANVKQLPAKLWREWALTNLLASRGGLVMVGDSTLCVGPSFVSAIKDQESAVFGITSEESRAIPGADVAPSCWVGWATRPHIPVWDIAASTWNRVSSAGPTSWSAAEARRLSEKIWLMQKMRGPARFPQAEGSRKENGTEFTPEDFLQKMDPIDPKVYLPMQTMYIAMDGDALVRDYRYGWFVRMSREQILESNFYWAQLAKKHQTRLVRK